MSAKVGLLTLPLHTNYGGILQIAALYQFLLAHGNSVTLLDKKPKRPSLGVAVKGLLEQIPGQNIRGFRKAKRLISVHDDFIRRWMPHRSAVCRDAKALSRAVEAHDLDAIIVGSDQVWRQDYFRDPEFSNYFLDFVADNDKIMKISYAASFGKTEWSDPAMVPQISRLLKKFDAVSTRELSGVDICKKVFDLANVKHVLDPTLLISPDFYSEFSARDSFGADRFVLKYFLDGSVEKDFAAQSFAEAVGGSKKLFSVPKGDPDAAFDIPKWVGAFQRSEAVITDSFHGMIFSIIFRKSFAVIPNIYRGVDRFESLLGILGLEDRLVSSQDLSAVNALARKEIDYGRVEALLNKARSFSEEFILGALEPERKVHEA